MQTAKNLEILRNFSFPVFLTFRGYSTASFCLSNAIGLLSQFITLDSEGYRTPHYIPRVYFKDYLPVTDTVSIQKRQNVNIFNRGVVP